MSASVHSTAIVDCRAVLCDGVEIGPYCVVGADVHLGEGTRLLAHVYVEGPTRIGQRNIVFPFCVLGVAPQDRGYDGERTDLIIGDDNVVREHVTLHRGTRKGGATTQIGSGNLLMVGVHIAHDVCVGDHVTLTNNTLLGGHAQLEDWVVTGGAVAIAPFVRIGESAFIAGGAMVERDVAPYVIAAGDRARVRALNHVGLERRGIASESRAALKRAFQMIFVRRQPLESSLSEVQRVLGADPHVARLVAFLRDANKRQPPRTRPEKNATSAKP
jgi:UDP-N-acetylglucosamine acyltransferase